MVEKERAQQIVMRQLHHLPLAAAVDALGATAAGAMQREPLAAAGQPIVDGLALIVVRVGTGDVAHHQVHAMQRRRHVGEAVANGGCVAALVKFAQQFDAHEVHVVTGSGSERKAADDEMCSLGHSCVRLVVDGRMILMRSRTVGV